MFGVLFPLAYAIYLSIESIQLGIQMELSWTFFLPDLIWSLALSPLFLSAAAAGQAIRKWRLPRWRIRDLLILTGIFGALVTFIIKPIFLAVPITVFVLASYGVYLFLKGVSTHITRPPTE